MMKTLTDDKPKSIIIDGVLHKRLKLFCRSRALKIGSIVEDLIKVYLSDPQSVQKIIDKFRKDG